MRTVRPAFLRAAATILLISICPVTGCGVRDALDTESIQREAEVVRGGYESAGLPLPDALSFEAISPPEIEPIIQRDVLRRIELLRSEDTGAKSAARDESATLSLEIFARYDPLSHTVFVIPDNLRRAALSRGNEHLKGVDYLRGLLLHECAHAVANITMRESERLAEQGDAQSLAAFRVLSEGYAQVLARQVARTMGWEEALNLSAESSLPGEVSGAWQEAERRVNRILEVGGEAGLAHAFQNPVQALGLGQMDVRSDEQVPWRSDFDAALDVIEARFPEDAGFMARRFVTGSGDLRASLAFLEKETQDRVLSAFERDRSVVLSRGADDAIVIGANIRQHHSAEEAEYLLIQLQGVFSEGAGQDLVEVSGLLVDWRGFFMGSQTLSSKAVASAFAVCGDLSVSLILPGMEIPPDEVRELLDTLIAEATN